jgi:DNA-binding MarR family transcriptional regulator
MPRKIPDVSTGTSDVSSEVADLLQAVTHRLRREARHEAGSNAVTWAQMRALRALDRMSGPTRMSGLADELNIARRSATSLVDELEARQLVARGHDPVDRRVVTVEVTPVGRRLLADLGARRREAAVGLLGGLSPEQLRTLRDLLARVVGPVNPR